MAALTNLGPFLAVAALELRARQLAGLPAGRCGNCQTWPTVIVLYEGDELEGTADCQCGYSVVVVRVEYVDMPVTPPSPDVA